MVITFSNVEARCIFEREIMYLGKESVSFEKFEDEMRLHLCCFRDGKSMSAKSLYV